MEKITMYVDDGAEEEFYVLEQTKLNGRTYLLVTTEEDGDSDAFILKETSSEDAKEAVYEFADDDEVDALQNLFAELLDDVDFER